MNLPTAVLLPVPFTSQAPLNNWADRQHTCEEASLVMVDRYLKGDHSGALIDPHTADAAINQVTAWKPAVDLTIQQVGDVARNNWGYAYKILPSDRLNMKQQLSLGRPLIFGVRTHGLGNPNYPGYSTHYEQPGWSVSHYLVVTGYNGSERSTIPPRAASGRCRSPMRLPGACARASSSVIFRSRSRNSGRRPALPTSSTQPSIWASQRYSCSSRTLPRNAENSSSSC